MMFSEKTRGKEIKCHVFVKYLSHSFVFTYWFTADLNC